MKCLVQLVLATTLFTGLVSSATPETSSSPTKDLLNDPQMQKEAPHFLQHIEQILRQPSPPPTEPSTLWTSQLTPIAVLNDIIKIVCLVFVKGDDGKDFDLSKIEAAKLEAIQAYGEETVHAASDFSAYDTEACMAFVDTVYDTVGFLKSLGGLKSLEEQQQQVAWGFKALGVGLDQASKGVKNLQSIIVPHLGGCETRDQHYLEGAEAVTYYASLIYGLAGATMASAPKASAVKALDVGQIIVSTAQLAIGFLMAQNVARMAGLDPAEECVKTTIYMTLAGEVEGARDLNRLRQKAMHGEIPQEVLQQMDRHAAEVLVTKGPGQMTGPPLRWLSGNRVGNDVKFVFCPDAQKGEEKGGSAVKTDEKKKDDGAEEDEEEQDKMEQDNEALKFTSEATPDEKDQETKEEPAQDHRNVENKLEL
ncbi:hypothetical protein BGZ68_008133 [Mortierella alpina]|nr:hypothetical protein BGZ68_008133 [Mortierella alpina]